MGNRDRDFYVTREMAEKVLQACPDAEWRLLFALARIGGFRCPSEHLSLKLDDVDWSAKRIYIDSPKTGPRVLPLFADLHPYLDEVWQMAKPGEKYFITRYRSTKQNLRTQLQRIIKRANLTSWPKLWQNLRASRQLMTSILNTNNVGGIAPLSLQIGSGKVLGNSSNSGPPVDHTSAHLRQTRSRNHCPGPPWGPGHWIPCCFPVNS